MVRVRGAERMDNKGRGVLHVRRYHFQGHEEEREASTPWMRSPKRVAWHCVKNRSRKLSFTKDLRHIEMAQWEVVIDST